MALGFIKHVASGIGHVVSGGAHALESGAKDVAHGAASVATTVAHGATTAASTVANGASDLAQGASSAANSLFDAGKAGFSSVTHAVGGAVSGGVNALEQAGSTIAHGASTLYHDARHDIKQGLVDASNVADKLGVGKILDGLGLGQVNQHDVQMNHHITDTYHRQSNDLKQFLGPGAGANWATYASWASDRAGQAIQNHDDPGGRVARDLNQIGANLPKPLAGLLGGPLGLLGADKAGQYNKAYENESHQAAKGNQKVFADISPPIQQLMDTFGHDKSYDQGKWNQFAAQLKSQGKDPMLIDGLQNYYKARFQTGSDKAQSVTLGNLQLGLHEQKYLQDNIAGAFPPGQGAQYTAGQSAKVGDRSYTLNHDLPGSIPPDLQHITNPQLKSLLSQWGPPNGDSLKGTGAQDWTNLQDRMKFISGLFLSTYNDPSLFNNPRAS